MISHLKSGVLVNSNVDIEDVENFFKIFSLNVNWLPLQGMSVGVLLSCAWMRIMLRRCYDVDRQLTTMVSWAGFMIMCFVILQPW